MFQKRLVDKCDGIAYNRRMSTRNTPEQRGAGLSRRGLLGLVGAAVLTGCRIPEGVPGHREKSSVGSPEFVDTSEALKLLDEMAKYTLDHVGRMVSDEGTRPINWAGGTNQLQDSLRTRYASVDGNYASGSVDIASRSDGSMVVFLGYGVDGG